MNLPTKKTKAVVDPHRLIMLVYGRPKIGKSTFCNQFPEALFLATEPGLNALDHYEMPITKYEDIDEVYNLLREDKKFHTIIIDTVDIFFDIIRKKALHKLGVENEIDLGGQYGQAYKPINDLFKENLNKFISLNRQGKGIIFTSHSKFDMQNRIVPSLPETPCKTLCAAMDLMLYFDIMTKEDGEKIRIIHAEPDTQFEAGDRTNTLPPKLILDYNKFISYFTKEKNNG